MGAGGSVRRSPAQMQAELERLRSKEMDLLVSAPAARYNKLSIIDQNLFV